MKRPSATLASAAMLIAGTVLAPPVSARDLVLLHETPVHNRILLDRDSVTETRQFDRVLREGVVSIDNSVSTAAVGLYAADVRVQADCRQGLVAVLLARAYAVDGSPSPSSFTPGSHELA